MPFNYLACSIKGTAFSEYSSLLLITREMNSLPGGVSLPNANPLPKHTLHLRPPSNPVAGPSSAQLSSLRLRAPREPPERRRGHQRHRAGRLLPCARPLAAPHRGPGPPPTLSPALTGAPPEGVRTSSSGRTFRASHPARSRGSEKRVGQKNRSLQSYSSSVVLGWSRGVGSSGREGAAVRFPDFGEVEGSGRRGSL